MSALAPKILEIALANTPEEMHDESIIYWNQTLLEKGDTVGTERGKHCIPFRGYHVFIDLVPQANWGHSALHLFINEHLDHVKSVEDQFPPWFGDLPDRVIVLYRYGRPPEDERNPDLFGAK